MTSGLSPARARLAQRGTWLAGAALVSAVVIGGWHTKANTAAQTSTTIIEHTEYWAKAGKADEVYAWRRHASDVREKIGLRRGRVLRRQGPSDTQADVIWEVEYANEAERLRDLKVRDESPEFTAVRDHMRTLYQKFDRSFWRPE